MSDRTARITPRPRRSQARRRGACVERAQTAQVPPGATGVITIDLAQIRANWRTLAKRVAPAGCAAVVKADAYGLGASARHSRAVRGGLPQLLRRHAERRRRRAIALAPGATIYVLDGMLPGCAREIAALGLRPVMASLEEARAWAALAPSGARTPPAALHVDTGLNRLGMSEADFASLRRRRAADRPARHRTGHQPPRLRR